MLKASVIGNLGGDPELKYSANGSPLLRFSVASNYRTKDRDGEWQDAVEWVRVTVFGQRAESLSEYLKKGMRVYCDGRLEARPWVGERDDTLHAGLELMASEVQFFSTREDDSNQDRPQQRNSGGNERQQRATAGAGTGRQQQSSSGGGQQRNTRQQLGLDDDNDDLENLPF